MTKQAIILRSSHDRERIIRLRDNAAHRRFHLKRANDLRESASQWHKHMLNHIVDVAVSIGISDAEALTSIDNEYNNMLAEAIAEENGKCMDRRH